MSTTPQEFQSDFQCPSSPFPFRKQLISDLRVAFIPLVALLFTYAQQLRGINNALMPQSYLLWSLAGSGAAIALSALVFSNLICGRIAEYNTHSYNLRLFLLRTATVTTLVFIPSVLLMYLGYRLYGELSSTGSSLLWVLPTVSHLVASTLLAALGAGIAAITLRRNWLFWILVIASPLLPYAMRLLLQNLFSYTGTIQGLDAIPFLSGVSIICSLLLSLALLTLSYRRFRRRSLGGGPAAQDARLDSMKQELLRKELQLQRTNLMFALAAVLLGFIGIIMAHGAGQEIMGFSTADIRTAIFTVMLTPVLTVILPIMMGSTAAASEKAMGVGRWQEALPVSRRRIVWTKVTVVALLCLVIAGIIPYLVQIAMDDGLRIGHIYRGVWAMWIALFCSAIGFYCGTIARDDYQGFLISIVPMAVIVWIMFLADPNGLVFPVVFFGGAEPMWKQWAICFRLLIIAGMFVGLGTMLLNRSGQPWWRKTVVHGLLIAVATFGLTMWNIVTERSWLTTKKSNALTTVGTLPAQSRELVSQPELLARPDLPSGTYLSNMSSNPITETGIFCGWITQGRFRSNQPYTVNRDGELQEFPQAADHIIHRVSDNGRWILAGPVKDNQYNYSVQRAPEANSAIVCGPWGLVVPYKWLPLTIQMQLLNAGQPGLASDFRFPTRVVKKGNLTVHAPRLAEESSDLELNLHGQTVVWKDGKRLLPAQYWDDRTTGVTNRLHLAGHFQHSLLLLLPPVPPSAMSVTAVLKPISGTDEAKLAGWVRGRADGASEDFEWAYTRIDGGDLSLARLDTKAKFEDYCDVDAPVEPAVIVRATSEIPGTSTTLAALNHMNLEVVKDGSNYGIAVPYYTYGSSAAKAALVDKDMLAEVGVMLVDPETSGQMVKIEADTAGLPGQRDIKSMVAAPRRLVDGNSRHLIDGHFRLVTHPGGSFAISLVDRTAILFPVAEDWYNRDSWAVAQYAKSFYPEGLFLSARKFLAPTDDQQLWLIDLDKIRSVFVRSPK